MLLSSSKVLLEVDVVQVASGLSWIWHLPPGSFPISSNMSLNLDNTYSFVMGKQCLFPFRMTASSNTSHIGSLTLLESGRRALTLVWICGVLVKEGGVTSGKAM